MKGINLLPWRAQNLQRQKKIFLSVFCGCLLVTILVIFIGNGYVSRKMTKQNHVNSELQQQIDVLNTEVNEINLLKEQQTKLMKRLHAMQQLQADPLVVVKILAGLARVMPARVYLTSVKREGNKVSIIGKAYSNSQVSLLMKNMGVVFPLDDVKLMQIANDDEDVLYSKVFELCFANNKLDN